MLSQKSGKSQNFLRLLRIRREKIDVRCVYYKGLRHAILSLLAEASTTIKFQLHR
jgi:hypothetical protein